MDGLLDLCLRYVAAILEKTVQDELLTIFTGRFALEIDYNRTFSMDLLEGIRCVVANRDDKAE
jgi:hypothetical protein